MDNFKDTIKQVIHENAATLSPDNIDKLANSLGKSLKRFMENKQDQAMEMKEQYEGAIKDKPLASVATACAVGIIIGLLCRRS